MWSLFTKKAPAVTLTPPQNAPDYLPLLRNELLEVIKKYVNVDLDAININVERDSGHEVLELSVALPDVKPAGNAAT